MEVFLIPAVVCALLFLGLWVWMLIAGTIRGTVLAFVMSAVWLPVPVLVFRFLYSFGYAFHHSPDAPTPDRWARQWYWWGLLAAAIPAFVKIWIMVGWQISRSRWYQDRFGSRNGQDPSL